MMRILEDPHEADQLWATGLTYFRTINRHSGRVSPWYPDASDNVQPSSVMASRWCNVQFGVDVEE